MKGLLKYRKGQQAMNIASLGVVAISLVVAAVILGLGGTILEKIQGTQTDNSATIPNNESWTWPGNNTLQAFEQNRVILSSVVVYGNVTKLTLNANYTVSSSGVKIINISANTNDSYELLLYNMTYGYNYGSEAYNSSNYGMTGVATVAEFIPTIAIVAVAAIVIGIILVIFGRKREEEA